MRLIAAIFGCLIALNAAQAQSFEPQAPGVVAPAPSPGPSGPLLTVPPTGPITPPKLNTFGDRVNRALQSYPLEGGTGNYPADRDSYVRQRANE